MRWAGCHSRGLLLPSQSRGWSCRDLLGLRRGPQGFSEGACFWAVEAKLQLHLALFPLCKHPFTLARGHLLLQFLKPQRRQVGWKGTKGRREKLLCTLNVNVVCPYWQSKPLFHLKHILQRSPKVILSFRTAEENTQILFSCSQTLPPLYSPLQKNSFSPGTAWCMLIVKADLQKESTELFT